MLHTYPVNIKAQQRGFTLMELAVVLMIVGFLLSGLLVSVGQNAEGNRRSDALAKLRTIEEALYGFAQSTGRLPCPATTTGSEATGGTSGCTQWHGFVSASALGINGPVNASGLLLDPWGNPYRYSVAGGFVTDGLKTVFQDWADTTPPSVITVCADPACDGVIANNIPVVVLSMGANWAQFSSPAEIANASPTNVFVSTTYSEEDFDDILLWISPNVLFTRMISAGRLP